MNIFAVHFHSWWDHWGTKQSTNSDADSDSNSPSTGARLQLWSQTVFLIPPWSRRLNSETGGLERVAPSCELGKKLGWGNRWKVKETEGIKCLSLELNMTESNVDSFRKWMTENHKSQSNNSMNYTSDSFYSAPSHISVLQSAFRLPLTLSCIIHLISVEWCSPCCYICNLDLSERSAQWLPLKEQLRRDSVN